MNFKELKTQFFLSIVFIFFSSLIIFEIPPRLRIYFNKYVLEKNFNSYCKNIKINQIQFKYGPCPNTITTRMRSKDYPIIRETISFTDSLGGRVNEKSLGQKFEKNKFNIYLIGDSFIQADEIPYEKTVFGLINNNANNKTLLKAYGFGYASWNTEEYLKSIKAINATNSKYDIYLFANDFLPSYGRSRYASLKNKSISSDKKYLKNFVKYFVNKSFTLRKLKDIYISQKFKKSYQDFWIIYSKDENKCKLLKENKNKLSLVLVDHLYYSLSYKCWEEIHKESYKIVLNDINNMKKEARKRNSKIRFIYIPTGFSIKGENFPGRTIYPYNIENDKELVLTGLKEQLKKDIGENFVDLYEPIKIHISKLKKNIDCSKRNCNNVLYYGYDGHFNEKGHIFLYKYLYENLVNQD